MGVGVGVGTGVLLVLSPVKKAALDGVWGPLDVVEHDGDVNSVPPRVNPGTFEGPQAWSTTSIPRESLIVPNWTDCVSAEIHLSPGSSVAILNTDGVVFNTS